MGTGLGVATTHPPKYVQMSTVSAAEKYHERANNAVLPVGAAPAAPRQSSAPSTLLAGMATAGRKENVPSATGSAQVLRVTPTTTVS